MWLRPLRDDAAVPGGLLRLAADAVYVGMSLRTSALGADVGGREYCTRNMASSILTCGLSGSGGSS